MRGEGARDGRKQERALIMARWNTLAIERAFDTQPSS